MGAFLDVRADDVDPAGDGSKALPFPDCPALAETGQLVRDERKNRIVTPELEAGVVRPRIRLSRNPGSRPGLEAEGAQILSRLILSGNVTSEEVAVRSEARQAGEDFSGFRERPRGKSRVADLEDGIERLQRTFQFQLEIGLGTREAETAEPAGLGRLEEIKPSIKVRQKLEQRKFQSTVYSKQERLIGPFRPGCSAGQSLHPMRTDPSQRVRPANQRPALFAGIQVEDNLGSLKSAVSQSQRRTGVGIDLKCARATIELHPRMARSEIEEFTGVGTGKVQRQRLSGTGEQVLRCQPTAQTVVGVAGVVFGGKEADGDIARGPFGFEAG